MKLKSLIYKLLRISNDINAIRRGRVGKRIGRRVSGRGAGKIIRKLFKWFIFKARQLYDSS